MWGCSDGLVCVKLEFQRNVEQKTTWKDLPAERIPNLIKIRIHVCQRNPSTRIMKKTTPKDIINKLLKASEKEKIFKNLGELGGWGILGMEAKNKV